MDSRELVSVYTVTNPAEGQMVCNLLEAEGIRAVAEGSNQGAWTGIEEILILVHAGDADRARKILARREEQS